jgi:hypothetical protein
VPGVPAGVSSKRERGVGGLRPRPAVRFESGRAFARPFLYALRRGRPPRAKCRPGGRRSARSQRTTNGPLGPFFVCSTRHLTHFAGHRLWRVPAPLWGRLYRSGWTPDPHVSLRPASTLSSVRKYRERRAFPYDSNPLPSTEGAASYGSLQCDSAQSRELIHPAGAPNFVARSTEKWAST